MLKQKFLISLFSEILIYVIGFISLIVITRLLGPYPIGVISSALAIMSILSIFGNLGLGVAHVKLVSEGQDLDSCISTFFLLKVFTSVLMIIIFFLLFVNNLIPGFKKNTLEGYVILVIFIATFINGFNDIGNFTLTATLRVTIGKSILIFQKLINSLLRIFIGLTKKSVLWLAFVELLNSLSGFIIYIFVFRNIKLKWPSKELFRKYISYGVPSFVITVNAILLSNVLDKIFLNAFISAEEVGYYTTALSLIIIFTFFSNNLNNILLPIFSDRIKKQDFNYVNELSKKVEKYIYIFFSPIIIYAIIYAKEIVLFLFSSKMIRTANILPPIIIYSFIFLLNRPEVTKILGSGKFKFMMWIDLFSLIISIFLFLIFIPKEIFGIEMMNMGGIGAAISLTINAFVLHIIYKTYNYFFLVKEKINIKNLLFLVFSFLIFFSLNKFQFLFSKFDFLIDFVVGFLFYFIISFKLNLISKSELKEFFEFFSLDKIKTTIYGEIRDL